VRAGTVLFEDTAGGNQALGAMILTAPGTVTASTGRRIPATSLVGARGSGVVTPGDVTTTGATDALGGQVNIATSGAISVTGTIKIGRASCRERVESQAGGAVTNKAGTTPGAAKNESTRSDAEQASLVGSQGGNVRAS